MFNCLWEFHRICILVLCIGGLCGANPLLAAATWLGMIDPKEIQVASYDEGIIDEKDKPEAAAMGALPENIQATPPRVVSQIIAIDLKSEPVKEFLLSKKDIILIASLGFIAVLLIITCGLYCYERKRNCKSTVISPMSKSKSKSKSSNFVDYEETKE